MYYVTCSLAPTKFLKSQGYITKKYAVECRTEEAQYAVAKDLSSLDGVGCVRLRKTKPRGRIILSADENYAAKISL